MWAIAEVYSNLERRARRDLRKIGFESYLPEYRNLNRHRSLLFPRYLFIKRPKHEPDDSWKMIFRVTGIMQLFLWGDIGKERPALIDDTFVDELKAMENENGVIVLGRSSKQKFSAGQQLQVVRGAFINHLARYVRAEGAHTDIATVELLGREIKASFMVGELAAIDAAV